MKSNRILLTCLGVKLYLKHTRASAFFFSSEATDICCYEYNLLTVLPGRKFIFETNQNLIQTFSELLVLI